MTKLRFEFKKNFFNIGVLFFLVVCSLLEIYKICEFSSLNIPNARKFGEQAYSGAFEKYGGRITSEKVKYVTAITLTSRELIQSGDYNEETDTTEYITGSLYTDYAMFSVGFYAPMKYSYEYSAYADGIALRALENIDFFNVRENGYEAEKNRQIYKLYSGRYLSEIYKNDGYENFFKYK